MRRFFVRWVQHAATAAQSAVWELPACRERGAPGQELRAAPGWDGNRAAEGEWEEAESGLSGWRRGKILTLL